jgi:hypothetical protein
MNERMNYCMNEWVYAQMNEYAKEWMCKWMKVQINVSANEWMCKWMNVKMNERVITEWTWNNWMNVGMKNEWTKECRNERCMWEWMKECALNKCGNEGMWNMNEYANALISNKGIWE